MRKQEKERFVKLKMGQWKSLGFRNRKKKE